MIDPKELERIRWRCRRGMLELDLVLIPFFDNHFNQLDSQEQELFSHLLEADDPDLYNWFLGAIDPQDPSLLLLVKKIRSYVQVIH